MNKKLLTFVFVIGIILSFGFVSSYTRSNYAVSNSISGGYSFGTSTFDKNICQEGQDFVLQIAPFGCSPTLVTSDLLEEQNVAVYCQLAATKINPAISVEAIESVTFAGEYPEQVAGVEFHPARAALGNKNTGLNRPILANIGYVVVVLKQEENESAMPEVVRGNLSAKIKYDIKNAFGLEKTTFYLSEMSSAEWSQNKGSSSFWNGQGYLRADSIGDNKAKVSVYNYDKLVDTVILDVGKKSQKIYFPGLECMAGFELKLDKLKNPGETAKLNIDGTIVEVAQGDKFLENRCSVKSINNMGASQSVTINCKEDDDGSLSSKDIYLQILPRVKLIVDREEGSFEVGDRLTKSDENSKAAYLGYVGDDKGEPFIIVVEGDISKLGEKLSQDHLQRIAGIYDSAYAKENSGTGSAGAFARASRWIANGIKDFQKDMNENVKNIWNRLFGDFSFTGIAMGDPQEVLNNKKISIIGYASPVNEEILSESTDYNSKTLGDLHLKATADYIEIIETYSGIEKYGEDIKLGREALYHLITLSKSTGQNYDMLEYCKEFKINYPETNAKYYDGLFGAKGICEDESLMSSTISNSDVVTINGRTRSISLSDLHKPRADEYGVEVYIAGQDGYVETKNVAVGENVYLLEGDRLFLESVGDDYAVFSGEFSDSKDTGVWNWIAGKTLKIELGKSVPIPNGYTLKLNKVNNEKRAQVSVLPVSDNEYSYANFSFAVGIEKRGIQLSPEKINETIANLDEQISDLNETAERLGTVVESLNKACLATGTIMTIMNTYNNFGGEATARKDLMENHWKDICEQERAGENPKGYDSNYECYLDKNPDIEKSVDAYAEALRGTNSKLEECRDKEGVSKKELFGETVNQEKLRECMSEFVPDKVSGSGVDVPEKVKTLDKNIKLVSDFSGKYVDKGLSVQEQRDLYTYSEMAKSNDPAVEKYGKEEMQKLMTRIVEQDYASKEIEQKREEAEENKNILGTISLAKTEDQKRESNGKTTFAKITDINKENDKRCNFNGVVKSDTEIDYEYQFCPIDRKNYLYLLKQKEGYIYSVVGIYQASGTAKDTFNVDCSNTNIPSECAVASFTSSRKSDYDQYSYKKSPEIKFFQRGADASMPAIVPFSEDYGLYAKMSTVLSLGGSSSYDDSGVVRSLYVCSVGEDGIQETSDDSCQSANLGYSGTYAKNLLGRSDVEAEELIRDAQDAVEYASKHSTESTITITRQSTGEKFTMKQGAPVTSTPEFECTNFMSAKQCQILFNVCDPVVCPSSRCDFGGEYPNRNVVQSGIVGSLMLCLPNIKQGIAVPICLTGVKAGLDGYLSLLGSYKKCLQIKLETGKTIGICDEAFSVQLCQLFWKEGIEAAKYGLPQLIGKMMGEGTRGGGEYLNVQSAFDSAQEASQGFLGYYQSSSNRMFQVNSFVDIIEDEVCKAPVSATYPQGSLFDSLTEPASPVQYHARFDTTVMTTATNPPTSHYKVYYHIYAGNNDGAYYRIYLKSSDSGGYYKDAGGQRVIDSGYIGIGETVDETKDFTAPSGYKELCINVNGQNECGFEGNQVSSSLAVDMMRDQYLNKQAENTNINSESDCLSSSASAYDLMAINPQSIAEDALSKSIYETGIIRVCSTDNPGKGVDESGWRKVGSCDSNTDCWLNLESVNDVIESTDLSKNFDESNSEAQERLEKEGGNALNLKGFEEVMKKIGGEGDADKRLKIIEGAINNVYRDNFKANLIFERGRAWEDIATDGARPILKKLAEEKRKALEDARKDAVGDGDISQKTATTGYVECIKYITVINKVAADTGVPANLIMAVMMQESSCDANAENKEAYGLMQITNAENSKTFDTHCKGYIDGLNSFEDVRGEDNAENNIKCGAKILSDYYKAYSDGKTFYKFTSGQNIHSCSRTEDIEYTGWDAALRGYVGWGCASGHDNYVEQVNAKMKLVAGDEKKVSGFVSGGPSDAITDEDVYGGSCKSISEVKNPYFLSCDGDAFDGMASTMTKDACEEIKVGKIPSNVENLKDCYGRTALHYAAAFKDDAKYFGSLLEMNNKNPVDDFGNIPLHYAYYEKRKNIIDYYQYSSGFRSSQLEVENENGVTPQEIENFLGKIQCTQCGGGFFDLDKCSENECIFIGQANNINCVADVQGWIVDCNPASEEKKIVQKTADDIFKDLFSKYSHENEIETFNVGDDVGEISSLESDIEDDDSVLKIIEGSNYILGNVELGKRLTSGAVFVRGTSETKILITGGGSSVGNLLAGGSIFLSDSEIRVSIGRMMQEGLVVVGDGVLSEDHAIAGGIGYAMEGGIIYIESGSRINSYIGYAMEGGKIIIEDGVIIEDESLVNEDALKKGLIEDRRKL